MLRHSRRRSEYRVEYGAMTAIEQVGRRVVIRCVGGWRLPSADAPARYQLHTFGRRPCRGMTSVGRGDCPADGARAGP
jgi:hypothetical protein